MFQTKHDNDFVYFLSFLFALIDKGKTNILLSVNLVSFSLYKLIERRLKEEFPVYSQSLKTNPFKLVGIGNFSHYLKEGAVLHLKAKLR